MSIHTEIVRASLTPYAPDIIQSGGIKRGNLMMVIYNVCACEQRYKTITATTVQNLDCMNCWNKTLLAAHISSCCIQQVAGISWCCPVNVIMRVPITYELFMVLGLGILAMTSRSFGMHFSCDLEGQYHICGCLVSGICNECTHHQCDLGSIIGQGSMRDGTCTWSPDWRSGFSLNNPVSTHIPRSVSMGAPI